MGAGALDDLARMAGRNAGPLLLVLVALVLIQSLALVSVSRRAGRERRRLREMLVGASGLDLEALLRSHARERVGLAADLAGAEARLASLETKIAAAKGRAGLVRFDAFADIGGEGSFALALLNDAGDGLVLSSIVGREGGRVYAKSLAGGRSDRALTDEEREAIRRAFAAPESAPATRETAGNAPR